MLYRAPMNHLNLYNKFKRLNTLEASVTIVGILLLTSCLLCSLFYLNDAIINGRETTLRSSDDELTWWFGVNVTENSKFGNLDKSSDENDEKNCDFYDGKWVYDETYPLYDTKDCYFAEGAFGCVHNGRPNNSYTKWRWQPNNCNMPRFDAKLMLEKLRNKRVVFVGDSIGRNQWESLLCMLSSAVSNKSSIYEVNGNPITKHMGFLVFMFQDYNCTVEYYRSPFLVVQNRPPPGSPRHVRYSLKIDKMDWNSNKYKDADVLIFNAGHWWTDDKTINSGCYFEEGHKLKMNMTVKTAFKRSIETLASWVDSEVNLSKTSVFFRSYAPVHYSYGTWKTGGSCHLHTQPDFKAPYLPYTWGHFSILNEALADYASKSNNVTKIELLDVTYLSVQRRDGHISIYSRGPTTPAPLHRQDCSHWCLPGVPDTWNELLYAVLHSRNFTIA